MGLEKVVLQDRVNPNTCWPPTAIIPAVDNGSPLCKCRVLGSEQARKLHHHFGLFFALILFLLYRDHRTFNLRSLPHIPWAIITRITETMGKKRVLVSYGVDVDAVAGWLGSYGGEDSSNDISRGKSGVVLT